MPKIIRIDKNNIFRICTRYSIISCRGNTPVFFEKILNSTIGKRIYNRLAFVSRTIVDNEQFKIFKSLIQNTFQSIFDKLFFVVQRNDDRKKRHEFQ